LTDISHVSKGFSSIKINIVACSKKSNVKKKKVHVRGSFSVFEKIIFENDYIYVVKCGEFGKKRN